MIKGIYTGLLFLSLSAVAQSDVQAETENSKPYITHTIASGETLSGLGRAYKLSVSEIASFNKIDPEKGLKKDQSIRIPLKASNLSQTECSTCKRVYYKVQPREGLYRIGLNFGNIKAETLKRINNLPGESVDIGQNLLVGYLPTSAGTVSYRPTEKPVEKETPKETVAVKTPETRKNEPTNQQPATPPQQTAPPVVNKPKEEPRREEPKQTTPVVNNNPPVIAGTTNNANSTLGTGAFSSGFEGKMDVSKSGTAAVFKSTSGWNDEKYYVLMNNAQPGTIVKVTNNSTSKTVYAKVLGELPQIKQNESILLRISNAAASALGGGEESMNVTVNY
jgi:LysM repeat protein